MKNYFLLLLTSLAVTAAAGTTDTTEQWNYHFQFTGIMQGHDAFDSPYEGENSLNAYRENAFSVTSTLFLGRRLWKGASLFFNPEVAGGKGISSALGIAGFTNGECFRIGDPSPSVYVARAFFRQHIAFGETTYEAQESNLNQLGGELVPTSRITITAGRFSVADVFDANTYSHDPRTQFMNWALMSNGAWDYPANTRGYTYGFIVEVVKPYGAIRLSETLLPREANGSAMDFNISRARGETAELEADYSIGSRKGVIRLLGFHNLSHGGNYRDAIGLYTAGTDSSLNINTLKTYKGRKYGIALNIEQAITEELGVFARAGWNDGHTATWAFTEIDRTLSLGFSLKGARWKRPGDVFGIAGVMNGISNDHRDFLDAGGYGFIIGDGKLPHYGPETIAEAYYSLQLTKSLWLTLDDQYVVNPAYNRDRGPANVWGIRGHVEF